MVSDFKANSDAIPFNIWTIRIAIYAHFLDYLLNIRATQIVILNQNSCLEMTG